MIDKLTVTVPFNGDELYEIIKLYDILRDMDFELSETQVEVFETTRQKLTEDFLMTEQQSLEWDAEELWNNSISDWIERHMQETMFFYDLI